MTNINSIVDLIAAERTLLTKEKALLVAISGIDGSGKGYLTAQIAAILRQQGLQVANINIDGWLNLPHKRFNDTYPAEHFYLHAIRFDHLFTQLILPLRDRRSIDLEADYVEETATQYRKQIYKFEKIDVILLEGIYLFKRQFQQNYDLSFWIQCSFKTALQRAIERSQEGLTPEETISAYQTIYFPAQEIHFERDQPREFVTASINNDPQYDRLI